MLDVQPRILHVVTRYLRGGSEQRIRDIVGSFPEGLHHVVLGSDSDAARARRDLEPAGLEVLPCLVREPAPAKDVSALHALRQSLTRERFDLMVTHQSKAGVLGRIAARSSGRIPTIHSLSMANFGPAYPKWQDVLFRRIERALESTTTAYAVVGDDLARRYRSIGIPEGKLWIVRSGVRVPTETRSAALRQDVVHRLGLPTQRPLILCLGSLESRKNVLQLAPFLVSLMGHSPSEARPFLVVAGEGPLRREVAATLVSHGLASDAVLLDFVDKPGALIAAADAMILLSAAEGVSQVLVQASVVGTPFVAYDVDGVRELLRLGAMGTAVPLGRLDEAAWAMARVLSIRPRASRPFDPSSWAPERIALGHRTLIERALGRSRWPGSAETRQVPPGRASAAYLERTEHSV